MLQSCYTSNIYLRVCRGLNYVTKSYASNIFFEGFVEGWIMLQKSYTSKKRFEGLYRVDLFLESYTSNKKSGFV